MEVHADGTDLQQSQSSMSLFCKACSRLLPGVPSMGTVNTVGELYRRLATRVQNRDAVTCLI